MRKYWLIVPCLLSQWVKEGYVLLSPFYSSVTLPGMPTWGFSTAELFVTVSLAAMASTIYSAARKEGRKGESDASWASLPWCLRVLVSLLCVRGNHFNLYQHTSVNIKSILGISWMFLWIQHPYCWSWNNILSSPDQSHLQVQGDNEANLDILKVIPQLSDVSSRRMSWAKVL